MPLFRAPPAPFSSPGEASGPASPLPTGLTEKTHRPARPPSEVSSATAASGPGARSPCPAPVPPEHFLPRSSLPLPSGTPLARHVLRRLHTPCARGPTGQSPQLAGELPAPGYLLRRPPTPGPGPRLQPAAPGSTCSLGVLPRRDSARYSCFPRPPFAGPAPGAPARFPARFASRLRAATSQTIPAKPAEASYPNGPPDPTPSPPGRLTHTSPYFWD